MKICDLCKKESDELFPLTDKGKNILLEKEECCQKCVDKIQEIVEINRINSQASLKEELRKFFYINY